MPAEPNSRLFHLRRFYYDTAGSANPVNMQGLKTLVGVSQIVFGTDAPFFDGAPQVRGLQAAGFTWTSVSLPALEMAGVAGVAALVEALSRIKERLRRELG